MNNVAPTIVGMFLVLSLLAIPSRPSPIADFFHTKSKQDKCALLSAWTDLPARFIKGPAISAVEGISSWEFTDFKFRSYFGKSYWALSMEEKKQIADWLRSCFSDWRSTHLVEAFAAQPPEKWILAIQKAQPSAFSVPPGEHLPKITDRERLDRPTSERIIDWFSLGLRIVAREVTFSSRKAVVPVVYSVREKGPAYFAGLQPGDAVSFLKCGPWKFNFIDQDRIGVSYFPSYSSARQTNTDLPFAMRVPVHCTGELDALFSLAIPAGDGRKLAQFIGAQTDDDLQGAWISDKQSINAGRQVAHDDLRTRYDGLRRSAFAEVRKSPCSYDVSNPYDLRAMPAIVRELASLRASMGEGQENLLYWRDVVVTYCDEERNGRLPSFEAALNMISRGKLDPCAYDPKVDYSTMPEDPSKLDRRYSRTEYDQSIDFSYFLKKLSTQTQRQCFYEILRAQFTGKTWTPRYPASRSQ